MADKFEREIDEILSKIHDFPQRPPASHRVGTRAAQRMSEIQRGLAVRLSRISVSQVMLTAMALMVFSYFFKSVLGELWVYGLVLGLILFFTAFALSLRAGSPGGRSEPYFRGQPSSYYTRNAGPLAERIKLWWRQQRPGRR